MPHDEETASTSAAPVGRPRESQSSLIGQTLQGRFYVTHKIAEGGMGAVYEAEDLENDRERVAVKVIKEGLLGAAALEAFEAERRTLQSLHHPHIVRVVASGRFGAAPFFAMELVHGSRTLDAYARDASNHERLLAYAQVCDAVAHAHDAGIIHFDLKPSNILVDPSGFVRVTDFGLARWLLDRRTGFTGGSLNYMSKAHLRAWNGAQDLLTLTKRCDVYALGVVLYELMSGELPRDVNDATLDEAFIADAFARSPRRLGGLNPWCDGEVEAMAHGALDERYEDARPIARGVRAVAEGRIRRWRWLGLAAAMLAILWVGARMIGPDVAAPAASQWSGLNDAYLRWVNPGGTPIQWGNKQLAGVSVIALRDDTDLVQLARDAGIDGVNPNERVTIRPLHGVLLNTLSNSGATVVVSDIKFASASAGDAALADGIRSLQRAGIAFVTAVGSAAVEDGVPPLSPAIAVTGAPSGCIACFHPNQAAGATWVWLAAQRSDGPVMPSLPCAALAAWRNPEARFDFTFDDKKNAMTISNWKPIEGQPGGRESLNKREIVPVGDIQVVRRLPGAPPLASGLVEGDRIALMLLRSPSLEVLEASTVAYQDVFAMDNTTLRRHFDRKVVVLGDCTTLGRDRSVFPGHGERYGSHMIASAIAMLMRPGAVIRLPTPTQSSRLWVIAAGAGVAGALGFHAIRRARTGWIRRHLVVDVATHTLGIAGVVALMTLGIWAGFRWSNTLISPGAMAIVAFSAWALAMTYLVVERRFVAPKLVNLLS